MLLQVVGAAKLRKSGDDEVTDLTWLRIARYQEHVSSDAIQKHLFACDSVVAQGQEDPGDVRVDLGIVDSAERVENVHYTLFK